MKRLCALLIPLVLLMSGCSPVSLENTAVIKALAFDLPVRGEDGFTMTACVLNPEGDKQYITIAAEGKNMTEVSGRLASTTERKPFFSQCEVILFSEELAKKGTEELLDWFYSYSETNKSALLCVLRGTASDAFLYTEGLFKDPAVDISRTLKNAQDNGGQIIVTLDEAKLSKDSISQSCLIPICEVTGEEDEKSFSVSGAGVLNRGILEAELSADELLGAKCLLGNAEGCSFTLSESGYGVRISRAVSALSAEDEKLRLNTELTFELIEGQYTAGENVSEEVGKHAAACIEKAVKKAKSTGDFMGLAAALLNKNSKPADTADWSKTLGELDISINVKAARKGGSYAPEGGL